MRTVLLGGLVSASLAVGVAWAVGQPGGPQPPAPPRPPEAPPVAVAAQPKGMDGPPVKLGSPRLTEKYDLHFKEMRRVYWSPDGAWVAASGEVAPGPPVAATPIRFPGG